MKKYINAEEFSKIITELEINECKVVYVENPEDNSTSKYEFIRVVFTNNDVVLYDSNPGGVGIIQDTAFAPAEDEIIMIFDDLSSDDRKVFIEEEPKPEKKLKQFYYKIITSRNKVVEGKCYADSFVEALNIVDKNNHNIKEIRSIEDYEEINERNCNTRFLRE